MGDRANRFLIFFLLGSVGTAGAGGAQSTRVRSDELQRYRSANASYTKAMRFFAKKEYERAVAELETCVDLLSTYADCRLALAKALYLLRRFDEALVQIEAGKTAFPVMSAMLQSLGQSRSDSYVKRRAEAQARLNTVNQQLVGASGAARSPIAAEAARLEAFIQDLDRELQAGRQETDPNAVPAEYFFFHGNILLRLERLDEAAEQYRQALVINPAYAEACNNLASLYFSAQKPQQALAVIEEAKKHGVAVNPELEQAIRAALPH